MNDQPAHKCPESVLVVVHTPDVQILLLERVHPSGFWQSVTGSLDPGETPLEAALRELEEETGLHATASDLRDWQRSYRFRIRPEWRGRYAPDVTHNTEHVFSLCLPAVQPVRISTAEHVDHVWLPRARAAQRVFSWTNRAAILDL